MKKKRFMKMWAIAWKGKLNPTRVSYEWLFKRKRDAEDSVECDNESVIPITINWLE